MQGADSIELSMGPTGYYKDSGKGQPVLGVRMELDLHSTKFQLLEDA